MDDRGKRGRIYIVSSDEDRREALKHALQEHGFSVHSSDIASAKHRFILWGTSWPVSELSFFLQKGGGWLPWDCRQYCRVGRI